MTIPTITYKIKVGYEAFGRPTYLQFLWVSEDTVFEVLNQIFRDTNCRDGEMWLKIAPLLHPKRTHTALSVGDTIAINDTVFRCEGEGWKVISRKETLTKV